MRTTLPFRTLAAAVPLIAASVLSAQQYTISTDAGGSPPATPAIATSTSIGLPAGIAVDAADNVYFSGRNCLFSLNNKGALTRIAGNSRAGYSGDGGPAIDAQITSPNSVAVDNSGNLYITDNYRVRRISAAGIITTVAGNGEGGVSGDGGPALSAQIDSPGAIAVDNAGNIYLAYFAYGVRRISTAGIITTIAGITGTPGYSGDGGPSVTAELNDPEALAVDSAGNLYIADSSNYRVRKVTPQGIITTFAGNGSDSYSGDGGPASAAQIDRPDAIAFDRNGNFYIAASYNFRVRKVSPTGVISTLYAGDASPGAEGVAIGFGADSGANVYLSDYTKYRIRKISANGIVSFVAGNGIFSYSGDGGPAIQAQLYGPQSIALDAAGDLFIADGYNSRIRRVSPGGIITTVAGNGVYGYSGDGGPATEAEFSDPWAVAVDQSGNLYIADAINNRVRRVSPNGIVTTIAGGDTAGYSGDGGPAIAAQLNGPTALAVDTTGNLYIADGINRVIRKVSVAGVITTVPGTQLAYPTGVAVDSAGNVYIADQANVGRISRVSPDGVATTLASAPGDLGGPPTPGHSVYPDAVGTDAAGNVYFTDSYNFRVRKISSDGTIVTIAGNGTPGYSGDGGPATLAQFLNPVGMAVDSAGKVYIADSLDNAIRLLQPVPSSVTVSAVNNAASNLAGPVSPGEIVVLYGSMLGPATLTSPQGALNTQLDGTSVSFNGTPAPLLYTSFTQVAAVVPDDVSGTTAQISLTWQGQTSSPMSVTLASSSPALFTQDSSGHGQTTAINQDGSVNSAVYPAPAGSLISLFATGTGSLPVTVTIGGQTLTPEYAGSIPGEAQGLMRIDVRIPAGATPGSDVPVAIDAGGGASQAGTTLVIAPRQILHRLDSLQVSH